MKALFLLALLASLALGSPELAPVKVDSIEMGGKTYTGCTVKRLDAVFATISHSSGSKRVEMEKLSEELQKQLGYDAKQASQVRDQAKKARDQQALALSLVKGSYGAKLTVLSVTEKGLLGELRLFDESGKYERDVDVAFIETATKDAGYLTDRIYRFDAVRRVGVFTYESLLGERTVENYRDVVLILQELEASGKAGEGVEPE